MIRFDNWTINMIFNGNVIVGPLQLNANCWTLTIEYEVHCSTLVL